ncbi:hypothetical protein CQA53_04435 [Helicobacter didelphidarum]|uniref:Uncharacterized protein n=1 Tax=Helicobacter didelphidarum TaxID=2040648 RepID=A0A3D8IM08_9HELI|nr:hypothetical protein [Helicobacter didelphidarum]RDU66259.1 hypothetical protein CQA53_04435 [Helicobacter didelphidarum]
MNILAILSLIWRHKGFLFFNFFTLKSFATQLNNNINNLKDSQEISQKVHYSFETLETILEFKKKNPKEFEELLDTLESLLNDYKKDPDSIHNLFK